MALAVARGVVMYPAPKNKREAVGWTMKTCGSGSDLEVSFGTLGSICLWGWHQQKKQVCSDKEARTCFCVQFLSNSEEIILQTHSCRRTGNSGACDIASVSSGRRLLSFGKEVGATWIAHGYPLVSFLLAQKLRPDFHLLMDRISCTLAENTMLFGITSLRACLYLIAFKQSLRNWSSLPTIKQFFGLHEMFHQRAHVQSVNQQLVRIHLATFPWRFEVTYLGFKRLWPRLEPWMRLLASCWIFAPMSTTTEPERTA